MPLARSLTSIEIREVGEALFGSTWQGAMAKGLGVPRQSVTYYLRSGANGAQAAAIIGLVARIVVQERLEADARREVSETRDLDLRALLLRLEAS